MMRIAYRESEVAAGCLACDVSATDAALSLKHKHNGNTYSVTVEQIGGVE